MSTKGLTIGILCFILLLIIIFSVTMFYFYQHDQGPFSPYSRPIPPEKHFYPMGIVTPFTQEEIERRNKLIMKNLPKD